MAQNGVEASKDNVKVSKASPKPEEAQKTAPRFPPPKTDKPRPHVCATCTRSFARLEHLKRHERSHTKEKPFECPQCQRCFARRDLLLRHQQKLHQAGAASTRPRNGRRESTSGMPHGSRARKNSIASSVASQAVPSSASMRPRANTISHVDSSGMNLFPGMGMNNRGYGMNGMAFPMHSGYVGGSMDFRASTNGFSHHHPHPSLPKLETNGFHGGFGGGLRTAPIHEHFDVDKLFGSGSTINPAQLHSAGGGYLGTPTSPFGPFPGFQNMSAFEDDDTIDFMGDFDASLVLNGGHEQAIDGSSPSAISTASQGFSEVMVDGSNNHHVQTTNGMWPQHSQQAPMIQTADFQMPLDLPMDTVGPAIMPELIPGPGIDEHPTQQQTPDSVMMSTPAGMPSMSPSAAIPGMPNQYFNPSLAFGSDTTSNSSTSISGSARHSSVTSVSTDSITDATRQALIFSLSQPSGFGQHHRKYSQPTISSPLSPSFNNRASMAPVSLPSTTDLQRYVNAYIQYFHPHMPFLHVPTLSFNTPVFTSKMHTVQPTYAGDGIVGGGGCLILSIAAIGALYEFEHGPARGLFEAAKKMINIYLEERRKSSAAANSAMGNHGPAPNQKTPLWLVQAMLLNLIFGHNCGDKQAAEIATTHSAALVGLAKAAELDKPDFDAVEEGLNVYANARSRSADRDADATDDAPKWRAGAHRDSPELVAQWYRWKSQEERKRTLYCVYVLSSLLVTAYNHSPRILNSELHLDLPCEEDLYAAGSAREWYELGGQSVAESRMTTFAEALSYLLTASQRKPPEPSLGSYYPAFGSTIPLDDVPLSELRPSTFGCYILINALHVYIWETRQRHAGRHWKIQETEQMHAQVEPALRAWQSAWKSNPHHTLERPSPYGPLPADSIPLLDLAYVRLFVNLGKSKESFFHRDFDDMANELGRGVEIIQHAEPFDLSNIDTSSGAAATSTATNSPGSVLSPSMSNQMEGMHNGLDLNNLSAAQQGASRRERHLRKAAAYAADSLQMADKLGVTFAEFTSRELPIQSAMCTFDCAQVLAEWVATVQERVGRCLGILGRDDVDFQSVPAIMLLGEEDLKLLYKINEYLGHADAKMAMDISSGAAAQVPSMEHFGFGSKLLLVTAYMLEKAAVWPVTHTMARALETHANVIQQRAERSVTG